MYYHAGSHVLPCIAMHCHVLSWTAIYYHVLPCITMYYQVLPCTPMYYHVLTCITMYWHILPRIAMYHHVLPCTAMYYYVLPCIAMHCYLLPCIAMYCHVSPCTAMYYSCVQTNVLQRLFWVNAWLEEGFTHPKYIWLFKLLSNFPLSWSQPFSCQRTFEQKLAVLWRFKNCNYRHLDSEEQDHEDKI